MSIKIIYTTSVIKTIAIIIVTTILTTIIKNCNYATVTNVAITMASATITKCPLAPSPWQFSCLLLSSLGIRSLVPLFGAATFHVF